MLVIIDIPCKQCGHGSCVAEHKDCVRHRLRRMFGSCLPLVPTHHYTSSKEEEHEKGRKSFLIATGSFAKEHLLSSILKKLNIEYYYRIEDPKGSSLKRQVKRYNTGSTIPTLVGFAKELTAQQLVNDVNDEFEDGLLLMRYVKQERGYLALFAWPILGDNEYKKKFRA